MKKLLALLLLSPLAYSYENWAEATNTLDLERLSQWFPNDSYIGMTCTNENSRITWKVYEINYKMMVFSLEERKGINLMWYQHKAYLDESKDLTHNWTNQKEAGWTNFAMYKNEKWSEFYIDDSSIEIENPGHNSISRYTLFLEPHSLGGAVSWDTPCKIVTEEEMKDFGYKAEKLYQKHKKIVDDNIKNRLKKRKL
ncbi:hypothetical protein N9D68_02730 [Gammaproteobacteria bacterium]|nr:hypothetical protein [Gammaproteobacteria bacterium]